ncbi:MAG: iron uptake porin [Cyanothece sp. SIO1E1]|nr:iron uptake porin [Cyanothece sp. SIO1E1]
MSKILQYSVLIAPALFSTYFILPSLATVTDTQEDREFAAAVLADLEMPFASSQIKPNQLIADASAYPANEQPVQPRASTNGDAMLLKQIERYSTDLIEPFPSNSDSYQDGLEPDALSQVTSVAQFSDVQPTDWAFQALQSLVERYGCIAGYPDSTFRGNRALSRYEFAAGLNACLDKLLEIVGSFDENELEAIKRLQEEFANELATLRGRVDSLEARTAELEANQFSTTTKLVGEVLFSVSDIFGDDDTVADNQTVFDDRIRLDFQTSFTGKDLLSTRIIAGNSQAFFIEGDPLSPFVLSPDGDELGTAEGSLIPGIDGTGDNDIELERLAYYFPIGERVNVYVAAAGGVHSDYVFSTVNPFFEDFDGGKGSISAFSQESPIYRVSGGTGAAINFSLLTDKDGDDVLVITGGYLAEEAFEPGEGDGLFNGEYAALGQITFTPNDDLQLAFTYINGFHQPGSSIFDLGVGGNTFFTGTLPANAFHTAAAVPAVTNSYAIQGSIQITPNIVISAFGGFTDLALIDTGEGEIWYYGLNLAFPDLLIPGNLAGISIGVEPYLGSVEALGFGLEDFGLENDTGVHIEAFYKLKLSDNISITPGFVVITAPDQNNDNDAFVIGTLRTTFSF